MRQTIIQSVRIQGCFTKKRPATRIYMCICKDETSMITQHI